MKKTFHSFSDICRIAVILLDVALIFCILKEWHSNDESTS